MSYDRAQSSNGKWVISQSSHTWKSISDLIKSFVLKSQCKLETLQLDGGSAQQQR